MTDPSRRQVLFLAAAAAAGPALPRSAAAEGALEPTMVIRTTGGVFEAALKRNFFDPFTAATGVRVVPVASSYGDMMAKSAAMQAAGHVEWDIISPQFTELATISQYFEDLGDCSSMPNVAADGVAGACGRWGVLYLTGAQVLAWNPKAYKDNVPQSWADFWDTKTFPGRRALPNTGSPWATLMLALLADGVPADKLFPLDMDRAFHKLDQIKPDIATWWRTGNQSLTMWDSDEIAMSMMWSGTAYAGKHAGIAMQWTYNQSIADFGAWCVLKGAPHPNAARAFINFYMANPEHHAAFAHEMGYTTSNKASTALLTPGERQELISSPEMLAGIIRVDAAWLNTNRATMLNRWNAWVSA